MEPDPEIRPDIQGEAFGDEETLFWPAIRHGVHRLRLMRRGLPKNHEVAFRVAEGSKIHDVGLAESSFELDEERQIVKLSFKEKLVREKDQHLARDVTIALGVAGILAVGATAYRRRKK